MRRVEVTWWVWRRGLISRWEVCDADGEVHCVFGARNLDGARPLRDLEGRDVEAVATKDSPDLVVRERYGSRETLATIAADTIRLGRTEHAFWASRDRTCRATITDPETGQPLAAAGPVKSHSYRPFLRIDITGPLNDPELTAVTLAYYLARDDSSRQPMPEGGAGGP